MTKTRNISDLLDANGDVKSSALDNDPASNDASALTTGTLPSARLGTVTGFTSTGIDDNATSTAITISSDEDVTFTEDILLGDGKKVIFGAGSDFEISHNSVTGNLFNLAANPLEIHQQGTNSVLQLIKDSGNHNEILQIYKGTDKHGAIATDTNLLKINAESALSFSTNSGSEAMRIHSNQRISMGTTSSGANLELASTKRTTGQGLESGGICLRNTGSVAGGNVIPITARLVNGANARAGIGFVAQTQDGGNAGYAGEIAFYTMGSADGASLTNSFERVRINKSGNFGIGTSTPASKFESVLATAGGNYPAFLKHTASSGTTRILRGQMSGHAPNNTDSVFITMGDSTTTRFNVFSNGDVTNSNNSYTGISDIKLKEQIVDASSQWNDIKNIPIKKFKFKTDVATGDSDKHWRLGVIAQEVEEVSPSLVSETTDLDDDHNKLDTVTKSVKYSILYMKSVKALQEAMERIETLEAKVQTLENNQP